ncbi:relaxase/mobilization nuclease domain-containing protein [Puia sp.]|jgi:hypothetical protein|uniref:relaxase/mobilization nuclease domain-containing protein n=1 Tax=Puia sp. TaxID=2045100 RepID=UPI002F4149C1
MIAKTFLTAQGFGESCAYVCQTQSRAVILTAEGVRVHDVKLMAADFEWQHGLMPEKEKPVYHCVLSFSPGERVEDERLAELGERYLEKVGMADTQYVLVKHTDKEHLHVHILANRVNNDGEPIGKGLIIERGIKAARELTEEYGLRREAGKRLDRTHREALHEPDAKRYHIYEAIREVLPRCGGLDDLEKGLLEVGIGVRYRCDAETGERQGISFRWDGGSFKGSRVDPAFSLGGLERTLALQQTLREEQALRETLREEQTLRETLRAGQGLDQEQQQQQERELRQEQGLRRGMRHGL